MRRLISAPRTLTATCNIGNPVAAGAGCDTYDMRFTFAGIVASTQSSFYDTGVVPPASPIYLSFTLFPSLQLQPGDTSAVWELEGADALSSPNTPSGPTTGFLTYWSGTPVAGLFFPQVLNNTQPGSPSLTGRRFFRFRETLRNGNVNNGRQCYDSFTVALSF